MHFDLGSHVRSASPVALRYIFMNPNDLNAIDKIQVLAFLDLQEHSWGSLMSVPTAVLLKLITNQFITLRHLHMEEAEKRERRRFWFLVRMGHDIDSIHGLIPIREKVLVLGRCRGPSIRTLACPIISGKHAKLEVDSVLNEAMLISDLKSHNGTFVNGALIKPHTPVELFPGDVISLGHPLQVPCPDESAFVFRVFRARNDEIRHLATQSTVVRHTSSSDTESERKFRLRQKSKKRRVIRPLSSSSSSSDEAKQQPHIKPENSLPKKQAVEFITLLSSDSDSVVVKKELIDDSYNLKLCNGCKCSSEKDCQNESGHAGEKVKRKRRIKKKSTSIATDNRQQKDLGVSKVVTAQKVFSKDAMALEVNRRKRKKRKRVSRVQDKVVESDSVPMMIPTSEPSVRASTMIPIKIESDVDGSDCPSNRDAVCVATVISELKIIDKAFDIGVEKEDAVPKLPGLVEARDHTENECRGSFHDDKNSFEMSGGKVGDQQRCFSEMWVKQEPVDPEWTAVNRAASGFSGIDDGVIVVSSDDDMCTQQASQPEEVDYVEANLDEPESDDQRLVIDEATTEEAVSKDEEDRTENVWSFKVIAKNELTELDASDSNNNDIERSDMTSDIVVVPDTAVLNELCEEETGALEVDQLACEPSLSNEPLPLVNMSHLLTQKDQNVGENMASLKTAKVSSPKVSQEARVVLGEHRGSTNSKCGDVSKNMSRQLKCLDSMQSLSAAAICRNKPLPHRLRSQQGHASIAAQQRAAKLQLPPATSSTVQPQNPVNRPPLYASRSFCERQSSFSWRPPRPFPRDYGWEQQRHSYHYRGRFPLRSQRPFRPFPPQSLPLDGPPRRSFPFQPSPPSPNMAYPFNYQPRMRGSFNKPSFIRSPNLPESSGSSVVERPPLSSSSTVRSTCHSSISAPLLQLKTPSTSGIGFGKKSVSFGPDVPTFVPLVPTEFEKRVKSLSTFPEKSPFKTPSRTSFLAYILNWNPKWLAESIKLTEGFPEIIGFIRNKLAAMAEIMAFSSTQKYVTTFYQHIQLVAWLEITREYRIMGDTITQKFEADVVCVMVSPQSTKLETLVCRLPIRSTRAIPFKQGALLRVYTGVRNEPRERRQLLGFVDDVAIVARSDIMDNHDAHPQSVVSLNADCLNVLEMRIIMARKPIEFDTSKPAYLFLSGFVGNRVEEVEALSKLVDSPFMAAISLPNDQNFYSLSGPLCSPRLLAECGSNSELLEVICTAVAAVKSPTIRPRFVLIEGAPRTGKTFAIVNIIREVTAMMQLGGSNSRGPILVVGATHRHIDVIARHLNDIRRNTANKRDKIAAVRFGSSPARSAEVRKLDATNFMMIQQRGDLTRLDSTLSTIDSKINEHLKMLGDVLLSSGARHRINVAIDAMRKERAGVAEKRDRLKRFGPVVKREYMNTVLQHAHVILTHIEDMFNVEMRYALSEAKMSAVVVDGAREIRESQTPLVFAYDTNCVVLVADTLTVFEERAQLNRERSLEPEEWVKRSLFERFTRCTDSRRTLCLTQVSKQQGAATMTMASEYFFSSGYMRIIDDTSTTNEFSKLRELSLIGVEDEAYLSGEIAVLKALFGVISSAFQEERVVVVVCSGDEKERLKRVTATDSGIEIVTVEEANGNSFPVVVAAFLGRQHFSLKGQPSCRACTSKTLCSSLTRASRSLIVVISGTLLVNPDLQNTPMGVFRAYAIAHGNNNVVSNFAPTNEKLRHLQSFLHRSS